MNELKFSSIMPPCKDCTSRYVGCHSKCKEYRRYRKQIDDANEMRRKQESMYSQSFTSHRKK